MKRFVFSSIALAVALACSSAPEDPTALSQPIAQNVTISRITLLQSLEIPVMDGGAAVDHDNIPLVALRDSVLRVFVSPGGGFSPHELTARARIVTTSPTGSFAQVFSGTQTISGESDDADITTTIQIPIPGVVLEPGSSVTVVLNDTEGDSPDVATSDARWPQDGSLADLGVRDGGDHLRVMIVPVEYEADGSHRLPDTSDDQIEAYRERFYNLYPTADVEITVHDPWPYAGVVSGINSTSYGALLTALQKLRASDQPDPDVYYYGAFEATSSFASFCGGGCITGLSSIGMPVSVGIGYSGQESTGTAVHEVGHAHGLEHAPCGGASAPDPAFPYPGGSIGVWGYDSFAPQMIDPGVFTDMMGYCQPIWISDFFFAKLWGRVRTDNGYFNDWMRGPARTAGPTYTLAAVDATGPARVSTGAASREPWIARGEPRTIAWAGGSAVGYFFPYDHLPGGTLWVPDGVPDGASVARLRPSELETTIAR
jgi:hypothetical protein